jgi:hypothetical protein
MRCRDYSAHMLTQKGLHSNGENKPSHAIQTCFKGLRKAIRLLLKHTRCVRRLKYGKFLLRWFAKKPNMTLKSILLTAEGIRNTNTLPTCLSVIKSEASGFLITNPTKVVTKITELETLALSLDPTLPPGARFTWLGYVRPTPTSTAPRIARQITQPLCKRPSAEHQTTRPQGQMESHDSY